MTLSAYQELSQIQKEIEANMNLEPILRITIRVYKGKRGEIEKSECLYQAEIPKRMQDRWNWYFNWRRCHYQCKYPRNEVDMCYSVIDRRTRLSMTYNSVLSNYTSAKAQVTLWERKIKEYAQEKRDLFGLDNDPLYQKALYKLKEKKVKFAEAEKALNEALAKAKETKPKEV